MYAKQMIISRQQRKRQLGEE